MPQLVAIWNTARDAWEVPGTNGLFCEHLAVYSEVWPTSGMTRNGEAYELPTSGPLMGGSGSLCSESGARLLPTPEAKLSDSGPDYARAGRPGSGGDDLTTAVHRLLPTPTTQDGANNGGPSQFERNTPPLNAAVLMLPTPRTTDRKTGAASSSARSRVAAGIANLGERVAVTAADETWGDFLPAIRRWEAVMGPAPAPTEAGSKGGQRLSARFTEWMMGQPAGWVTDPAIGISRSEQLKACGNGVVTQQAAFALADMLEAIGAKN
ncbi:DNA methyltransferase [Arthrobacter phage Andrew]|uniref:DNA methyltransferase n=1 Tax=Arthrobacter phage Andrew TaxID=2419946 RepID=A0A3G2KCX4_9CAUD|nr:DNA methyltransferase [Arthrobacter phage Andrew]AYN56858.1 DNA methyltransferase [Arthrobacter phage Andrew]